MTRWFVRLGLVGVAGCEPQVVIDGAPVIEAGTGEFAFEAVTDGQEVELVHGPQGGWHIWLGVRTENLQPRGLQLVSTAFDVATGAPIGPDFFFDVDLFPVDGSGGTAWQYAGLPHQVAPDAVRGKRVRLHVDAQDADGRTASDDEEVEVKP